MSDPQPVPTKFGLLLYPGFEVLDVFGPLEALNVISREEFEWIGVKYIPNVSLSVITSENTYNPISPAYKDKDGSCIVQKIVPDHTIYDAPEDLEVLLIPGGLGSSDVNDDTVEWVRKMKDKLRYLITVCTGADIAARAGALCGLKATTNKQAWTTITSKPTSAATYWVAHARWVKSSNKIWTTSGVSAGTDGFVAWIKAVYGEEVGTKACQWMEYVADTDPDNDRFSKGLKDVPPTAKCVCTNGVHEK